MERSFTEEFSELERLAEVRSPGVLDLLDAYSRSLPEVDCWQGSQSTILTVASGTTPRPEK